MLSMLLLAAVISLSLFFFMFSSYWFIHAIFSVSESPFFSLTHIVCLSSVINFLVLLYIVWIPPSSILRMTQNTLIGKCPGVYPFDEISTVEFAFMKFSCLRYTYLFFLSSLHFWRYPLPIFQVPGTFFFSKRSISFLIWQQLYSFRYLSFFASHY